MRKPDGEIPGGGRVGELNVRAPGTPTRTCLLAAISKALGVDEQNDQRMSYLKARQERKQSMN